MAEKWMLDSEERHRIAERGVKATYGLYDVTEDANGKEVIRSLRLKVVAVGVDAVEVSKNLQANIAKAARKTAAEGSTPPAALKANEKVAPAEVT
jgi:hypothetical protein